MKRALLRVTAFLAGACLLAACGHGGGRQSRQGMTAHAGTIPTATAKPATIHPKLTISGIIAPYQNVMLTNNLAEPADAVNVNEGDRVTKGEIIAVLNTADLQAQYESAEHTASSDSSKADQAVFSAQQTIEQAPNTVSTAREALNQSQSNLNQANADLARDRSLESQGYLSAQSLQTQQTLANVYTANVRSNQAALNSAVISERTNGTMQQGLQAATISSARQDAASAQADARNLSAQISRATIVSPVDGIVVNRNLNPGEYPGSRTIFVVQQDDPVFAELNASSADVFRIHAGAPVALTIPGQPNARYQGSTIGVLGQVSPGSTNFTVKVLVRDTKGALAAGLPVTGVIALPSASGVGIPVTAFLDDSHTSVMIDNNGTAARSSVREVANDGTTSIVEGLKSGTTVISNGQLGIAAGEDLEDGP